ncbi:MAG: fibronectin type III-like domain-contianing protein, partial [Roseburia sp.]|nr:fibronectin type III-like domain-contianing protein [Roseburia sp.]
DLFDGDEAKIDEMNRRIAAEFGFDSCFTVCGQTYPRKVDARILNCLSSMAQSVYRMANDIRLLQHDRQLEEPFEEHQIGSSAMAYKRNPMRCERICSLSRYLMADAMNAPMTASVQWMERTLDDSANRRLSMPEGFLCADAILRLAQNVTDGLRVNEKVVDKTIREYMPFLATENLMMEAVKRGGDRQQLHERVRVHSMAATARMKDGEPCDLLDRLAGAGKDVVVVLAGGSPVETPWLPRAKAVLYTALGGEGVGEAVFQLLYGRACPAGRLAETWPKRLEDTPAARHWPMGPDAVTYNESIYVGYRYYDKAHVDVRFPFGYGLSYTSFAYSGLTLSRKVLAPGKAIEVLFTVENTGAMAGVETAQVYVAHRNSAAHQPVRTLAGFARVALKPGERKTVCVTLPPSALEFYDVARHAFVVEAGRYEVSVGRHSRCLLLHAAFTARGETVALPPAHSAGGPYGSFADNTFPDAAFAAIHTRPLPRNQKPVRGEYTQTTVLGDMLDSRTGRALHALALCAARLGMHFSNNPAVNRRVCEMTVRDLPFKNLVLNTSGIIRYPAAEALLALANGRLFSRGGTVRAERGRSRKG